MDSNNYTKFPYLFYRFLAINPTKRGVKTCQDCFKKIGYRAKQCKYCSPLKHRRRPRLQNIKPSLKPISSKTAQLIAQHIACDNSEPVENDIEVNTDEQGCENRLDNGLLSGNIGDQQLDTSIVTQTQEEHMETMVTPLDNSRNQEYDTTIIDCNTQPLDAEKTQEAQMLSEATRGPPQEDQQQLDDAVDNLLNQPEKIVLDSGLVSTVAEVTNTGEAATTSDSTVSQESTSSDSQEVVNTVFISSKVSQTVESQGLASNSGRYSLQDLICGLLAQNQGIATSQNDTKQANTPVVSLDTESLETSESRSRLASSPKENAGESSYDANSVALFLGEMAQRNNGKKRKIYPLKTHDSGSKVVALIPGTNQKCILMTSDELKAGKFRKIQPKDICASQEEISSCDEDKETARDNNSESKEQQCR